MQFTKRGRHHLEADPSTRTFVERFVLGEVEEWKVELEGLSTIAHSQLQAAYSAITHGLHGKWAYYLARTIAGVKDLIQPMEDVICNQFIRS